MKNNGTMIFAVKAVLCRPDGRCLALRREPGDKYMPGAWDVPGGKIDFGETPDEALVREIEEETGIAAQVTKPLAFWTAFPVPHVQYVGLVSLCLCAASDSQVVLSHEHDEFRWLAPSDVAEVFSGHTGLEAEMVTCDWDKINRLVRERFGHR